MPAQVDVPEDGPSQPHIPIRAKFFLCTSYALAAWAWRSWEFIVALVLIELYPNSLLMVSAYGLLDNFARVLLGPAVGNYVDRHERLPCALVMLRLQNLCIGSSAAAALMLLWPGSPFMGGKASYWLLMWSLTLLGAVSSAGSTGVSIAVEREAVRALCGDNGVELARLNAGMRAIDLTALLCAPLVAGLLMTGAGAFAAVAAMAAYCGGAYLPEVLLLTAAFRVAPVLGQSKARLAAGTNGSGSPADRLAVAVDGETDSDERTGLLAEYDSKRAECASQSSIAVNTTTRTVTTNGQAITYSKLPDKDKQESLPCHDLADRPMDRIKASRTGSVDGSIDGRIDGSGCDGGLDGSGPTARLVSSRLNQPLVSTETPLPASVSASRVPEDHNHDDSSGNVHNTQRRSIAALSVARPTTAAGGGKSTFTTAVGIHISSYVSTWRTYLAQPVLLPCVALALLYMTVLSLGFLMTSFLSWSGLSEAEVSGYRGIGALTGLLATAIFPPLAARAGLRFCAVSGVTYQLVCLSAGVLPVVAAVLSSRGSGEGGGGALHPSLTQVRILVAGLVMSRTGLWLYDLAVTQLIQENVLQDDLGSVYGVQSSLQASFEMLSFLAGLFNPDPQRFHWLMLASLCSVAAAAVLAWAYICCSGVGRARSGGSGPGAGVDGCRGEPS